MKKITFLLTLTILTFSIASAATLKIGYINIDRVVSNSPQFIEANQAVIKEFKPQEDKLIALGKKISSLLKKFKKNKEELSKSETKSEITKIAEMERQLKQKITKLRQQLKLKNSQELGKIEDLINQVINEVAKAQKFDLILYQKVAYVSEEINITSTISEKLRLLFE